MKTYHVYIMASLSRRLYVGSTSDLLGRVVKHRTRFHGGHTAKYRIDRLVYYETTGDARSAVARERQLETWTRAKKIALIETVNLGWLDLAAGWLPPLPAG